MSIQPPSSSLPRQFGRYLLYDQIGEGGMAQIYLGREQTDLGGERKVVVKHILPLFAESAELARLLVDEAKLAAQLTHGNVVKVYDLGREQGTLYIAMEYVEGFDLRDLLKSCSKVKVPLPVEFSLLIVTETLRALDYAHRKRGDDGRPLGIVHRDVSPSNVLVSFDGQIKLCDFGIARAIGIDQMLPDEAIQGKAGYMSPEAAAGMSVSAQSDVFAVGVILWELLAGRRLYRTEPGRQPTLEQARSAVIPDLPRRGLPQEEVLLGVVRRALCRQPEQRYASAREMLRDLESYVAQSGLLASPLKLGQWLTDHFGAEILERRRAREVSSRLHTQAAESPAELDSLTGTAVPLGPPASASLAELAPHSMEPVARSIQQPPSAPSLAPAASSSRKLALIVVVLLVVVVVLLALGRATL